MEVAKPGACTRVRNRKLTRKVPRVVVVKLNFSNNRSWQGAGTESFHEVMNDEFFVRRMESETRWIIRSYVIIYLHSENILSKGED